VKCYPPRSDGRTLSAEHTKPFFVADNLDDLRGPTRGTVVLPITIDWTPANTFDLSRPVRVRSMYAKVLTEAPNEQALARFLSKDLLLREWRLLRLPTYVRQEWEAAHAHLVGR